MISTMTRAQRPVMTERDIVERLHGLCLLRIASALRVTGTTKRTTSPTATSSVTTPDASTGI